MAAGCAKPADGGQPVRENQAALEFASELSGKLTVEAMVDHLAALQDIADAHGGTRAVGTPGYDASVDYVVGVLRDAGFEVQTPQFQTRVFNGGDATLTVGGAAVEASPLKYTVGTDGVSGPLVAAPADETPGCAPSDYEGLPVKGAVILVDRGKCPFAQKGSIAAKLGAVAVVVADNVDQESMGGTLGEDSEVGIPVVGISKADGARLRGAPGPVKLALDATTETISARNVIAQTATGSAQNVVMVGGHLDSVPEGPGINDNGSGVAAILETAVQLGNAPAINNAVRFGFWGAEEIGIVGSRKYLESLDVEQLKDIALYLNFDMLGSPNPGYFTYDGDQSTALGPDQSPPRVPEGSAGIERTLVDYLKKAGEAAEDTSFDGRSDYDGFTRAGIPAGGLFSGAEEDKSPEQEQLWGGTANAPFDPNYHKETDTLEHVDRDALRINGGGVAYGVGFYAQDLSGRNGMPAREDRTRHELSGE
ncbi:M28 family metallopeptidase [Mycolicibacterium sp.]|uniref:M28 family metallopeptidase n=1 Tax=Mycolicibacterium sp. TaxID=2320850 RepID=UPI0025E4ADCC|nr:M28 family metallopeptidase [Mycolicibacterium sp.]